MNRKSSPAVPFADMVRAEFHFLEPLGFRPSDESADIVRYESNNVFVRVFHDSRENYVGVQMGLAARPRDVISKEELLTLANAHQDLQDWPERPTDLHSHVARAAQHVRRYGGRALSGEPEPYDEAIAGDCPQFG